MTTALAPYVMGVADVPKKTDNVALYHYSVEAYRDLDGQWWAATACDKRLRVLSGSEVVPDAGDLCAACWRAERER